MGRGGAGRESEKHSICTTSNYIFILYTTYNNFHLCFRIPIVTIMSRYMYHTINTKKVIMRLNYWSLWKWPFVFISQILGETKFRQIHVFFPFYTMYDNSYFCFRTLVVSSISIYFPFAHKSQWNWLCGHYEND